jgi:hypothetical protein
LCRFPSAAPPSATGYPGCMRSRSTTAAGAYAQISRHDERGRGGFYHISTRAFVRHSHHL